MVATVTENPGIGAVTMVTDMGTEEVAEAMMTDMIDMAAAAAGTMMVTRDTMKMTDVVTTELHEMTILDYMVEGEAEGRTQAFRMASVGDEAEGDRNKKV